MLSQTLIIIIITVLLSISAFNNHKLYSDLLMYPPAITKGQYYRLLTSGFIHADYQHLLFNMLTLYFFGGGIEKVLTQEVGYWAFLFLYLGAIVVSDLPSYLKHKNSGNYSSLGASGGVSAIVFAFIVFAPWSWFTFPPVPAIIYGLGYIWYSMRMSKQGGDNINHDAHLYGALFGVLFVFITMPGEAMAFLQRVLHPQWPM